MERNDNSKQKTGGRAAKETELNTAGRRADNSLSRDEDVIDLRELFWGVLKHWKMIFLFALIGALLMGVYYTRMVTQSWQGSASIFIKGSSSQEYDSAINDVVLSNYLSVDYVEILTSREVYKQVIDELDLDMDYQLLGGMVSVSNEEDSHIYVITVTADDPKLCRNIANCMMTVGQERIYKVIGDSKPEVVDNCSLEDVIEVTPSLRGYVFKGGFAGAVLICIIYVIRIITDTAIKNEEELRKNLGVSVLAVVPYYEDKKNS